MGTIERDLVRRRVLDLAPSDGSQMDSPYFISNELYAAERAVLHDVGGQPDAPQPYLVKEEAEWEKNVYITCECLGWRGAWNSEMRRRSENDLGMTQYFGFPYYGRWITGVTKTLINAGLITPDELAAKIDDVRVRLEAQS